MEEIQQVKNQLSEYALTLENVKSVLLPNAKSENIPDSEIIQAIAICQARGVNPFTREVYLIPRAGKLTLTVSKDFYISRAFRNPKFRGFKAGIVILQKTQEGTYSLSKREGALLVEGDKLIGGWCSVFIEGYKTPINEEVSLQEYSSGRNLWASKPATMIRKVAIVQALREAFPNDFAQLYDNTEIESE